VTIAVGRVAVAESAPGAACGADLAALAAACDVHLEGREQLADFLAGFERTPCSALAFVQLLRGMSPTLTLAQGLVAESFVYSTLQSGPEFQRWLAARRPGTRTPPPPCARGARARSCASPSTARASTTRSRPRCAMRSRKG